MHLQLERRPGDPDLSADALVLAFAATPGLEVVATMDAPLPGGLVAEVEVLAASHRVRVRRQGEEVATEQVACLGAAARAPLPAAATHRAGGLELAFRAERPDLDDRRLAALAASLRDLGDAALVVSFPGHPDAITSVQVLDDGWETWHLYPGAQPAGVRTRTVVRR